MIVSIDVRGDEIATHIDTYDHGYRFLAILNHFGNYPAEGSYPFCFIMHGDEVAMHNENEVTAAMRSAL